MEKPTAPVPNRPQSDLLSEAEPVTLPLRKHGFDERHFFDRLEYITIRLFLYSLALLGMYAVIKEHIK